MHVILCYVESRTIHENGILCNTKYVVLCRYLKGYLSLNDNDYRYVSCSYCMLVSSPDLTLCEGKGRGTLERFLGHAHQHYFISIACDVALYFRSWCSFGPKESNT